MTKIFYILSYLTICKSFNIDLYNTIWKFNGENKTSFGHSLSLHTADERNSVLVGAPLYGKEGGLYKCIDNDQCELVDIPNKKESGDPLTSSLFGGTVTSNGDSVLSCGHKWASRIGDKSTFDIRYKGQCVLTSKNLTNTIYDKSACLKEKRPSNTGYDYCISGFSSTGFKTSANVPFYFIGAPGATSYKGVVYGFYGDTPLQIKSTQVPIKENSHLGYSVAWGRLSDSRYGDIVSGAPRDINLKGKIFIYSILGEPSDGLRMEYVDGKENPDDQIGSYFGASICLVDLDNDGKDDVLVGAPRFSKVSDEGRVYVYLSRRGGFNVVLDLMKKRLVGEEKPHSKFGTVIANIGDINNDGYPDIAIGAPNSDHEEKGAVYIYNGGKDGLRSFTASQVIYASDIPNVLAIGFGKSISGGLDIDDNEFPDISIGAPQSNNAFLFRTSPLVILSDNIEFNVTAVPFRESCVGPDGRAYQCVELRLNLMYEGKGTPNETDIEVYLEFDSKFRLDLSKRAFVDDGNRLSPVYIKNITLTKDLTEEVKMTVYFTVGLLTDVTSPVKLYTNYTLYKKEGGCDGFPCPVLDKFGTTQTEMEISYLRECGDDKICRPEVSIRNVRANLKDVTYGGNSNAIDVEAAISNEGENAYNTIMTLSYNSDFEIRNVIINGRAGELNDPIEIDNFTRQVQFPLANPIRPSRQVGLMINFGLDKERPSFSQHVFAFKASSFGNDTNTTNNAAEIVIGSKIRTCVRIQGETSTPIVTYPEEPNEIPDINPTVEDLGPEIKYTFFIQNSGRLSVDELVATIKLNDIKDVNDVLYVVGISVDGVPCPDNTVDTLKLTNPRTSRPQSNTGIETVERRDLESCPNGNSKEYSCRINSIDQGKYAQVVLQTRFCEKKAVAIRLQRSDIEAQIKVRFNGTDAPLYVQGDGCELEYKLNLLISPSELKTETEDTKWWIVLLSVIAALTILAIITAILFWTGFFQREKSFAELQEEATVMSTEKTNPRYNDDDDDDD